MSEHDPTPGDDDGDVTSDASSAGDADLGARVEAALRAVRDPEADVNVFEAGIVEDVRIAGGDVTVEADLSGFGRGEDEGVVSAMVRAVRSVDGVERAHVERATPEVEAGDAAVADADRVIAVASAKGGVGKSTIATHLAAALAARESVGLFDADIHGPNVPDLLDVEGPVYSDDDGNPLPVDAGDSLAVMSVGLMQEGAPLAWRGAMAHDALTELFEDTAWTDPGTLVIDLPPGTGDVVLTTLQEVPVDGVVVVTTPFHAAVTDTHRSVQLFRENDVPVLGVVVNMHSFACRECGEEHDLFRASEPLADLDAPVLAELPFTHDLQETPLVGEPPAAMAALARAVDERYDEVWDVTVPAGALDLRGVPAEARHDRVREAYLALDPGDPFVLVSDRDPSAVQGYLADLADDGVIEAAPSDVAIRQQNPETWSFRAERPG